MYRRRIDSGLTYGQGLLYDHDTSIPSYLRQGQLMPNYAAEPPLYASGGARHRRKRGGKYCTGDAMNYSDIYAPYAANSMGGPEMRMGQMNPQGGRANCYTDFMHQYKGHKFADKKARHEEWRGFPCKESDVHYRASARKHKPRKPLTEAKKNVLRAGLNAFHDFYREQRDFGLSHIDALCAWHILKGSKSKSARVRRKCGETNYEFERY